MAQAASPRTRAARELFAPLGPTYDRYARLLSFGQDPRWRRFLVERIEAGPGTSCSTSPPERAPSRSSSSGRRAARSSGSTRARRCWRRRVAASRWLPRRKDVRLVEGRAEELPFEDGAFDALTVTYLLRYVDDPGATLAELARVVRSGGTLASLEFGVPPAPLPRAAWELYTGVGLPLAGRIIGTGWSEVGGFLRGSIRGFYERLPLDRQLALWREAGVEDIRVRRLSLGGGIVIWGRKA